MSQGEPGGDVTYGVAIKKKKKLLPIPSLQRQTRAVPPVPNCFMMVRIFFTPGRRWGAVRAAPSLGVAVPSTIT
jgi:hypothetical protein